MTIRLFSRTRLALFATTLGSLGAAVLLDSASTAMAQSNAAGVNSEWVESSSPLTGGGTVSTTYFPESGRSVTNVQEAGITGGLTSADLQRQAFTSGGNASLIPAVAQSGLAPIPTGNGGVLVPTVNYVPLSGAALANYQAAYPVTTLAPAGPQGTCATCQSNIQTQPTFFQQPFQPQVQVPFANQQPVLPQTNSGVYGPIAPTQQVVPGFTTNPAFNTNPGFATAPGFTPVPAAPTSGFRSLIPRSLPAGTYIGQGWLGQPKAYVNSQPFRNALRYLIVP